MSSALQQTGMIRVSSSEELARAVAAYVGKGYQVHAHGQSAASLVKHKEFNVVIFVLGIVCCTLPGLAYLAYYSFVEKDQALEIRVLPPAGPAAPAAPGSATAPAAPRPAPGAGVVPPQMSPDGTHWWDGTQWQRLGG